MAVPVSIIYYTPDSTCTAFIGYSEHDMSLQIMFWEQFDWRHVTPKYLEMITYEFHNVPVAVFKGLRDASSQGQYYHEHIFGQYDFSKQNGFFPGIVFTVYVASGWPRCDITHLFSYTVTGVDSLRPFECRTFVVTGNLPCCGWGILPLFFCPQGCSPYVMTGDDSSRIAGFTAVKGTYYTTKSFVGGLQQGKKGRVERSLYYCMCDFLLYLWGDTTQYGDLVQPSVNCLDYFTL